MPKPEVNPIRTMKISSRPNSIPIISTIKVALLVMGLVMPMDEPTVLIEEAKSNIASVRVQFAVTVRSREPMM